jgi:hypothetical protein
MRAQHRLKPFSSTRSAQLTFAVREIALGATRASAPLLKVRAEHRLELGRRARKFCHFFLSQKLSKKLFYFDAGEDMLRFAQTEPLYFAAVRDRFTDAVVRVAETTFHVHRVILAAHSSYFHTMFSSTFKEGAGAVVLEETTPGAFGNVLDFMYSGACTTDDFADAMTTLQCAHKCAVGGMVVVMDAQMAAFVRERAVSDSLTIVFLLDALCFAQKYDLAAFRRTVLTNLAEHPIGLRNTLVANSSEEPRKLLYEDILEVLSATDLDCSETVMFDLAEVWIDSVHPSEDQAETLLSKVRFAYIPPTKRRKLMQTDLGRKHIRVIAHALDQALDHSAEVLAIRGKEFDGFKAQSGDRVTVFNNLNAIKALWHEVDTHSLPSLLGQTDKIQSIDVRTATVCLRHTRLPWKAVYTVV